MAAKILCLKWLLRLWVWYYVLKNVIRNLNHWWRQDMSRTSDCKGTSATVAWATAPFCFELGVSVLGPKLTLDKPELWVAAQITQAHECFALLLLIPIFAHVTFCVALLWCPIDCFAMFCWGSTCFVWEGSFCMTTLLWETKASIMSSGVYGK